MEQVFIANGHEQVLPQESEPLPSTASEEEGVRDLLLRQYPIPINDAKVATKEESSSEDKNPRGAYLKQLEFGVFKSLEKIAPCTRVYINKISHHQEKGG